MLGAGSTRLLQRAALARSFHVRHAGSKPKTVMLNAARLDFDGRMNWDKVKAASDLTMHDITATEEILSRVQGATI
eukprot:14532370-Heterocapsa_arctica.AAC.1